MAQQWKEHSQLECLMLKLAIQVGEQRVSIKHNKITASTHIIFSLPIRLISLTILYINMNLYKSQTIEPSHIDNFSIRSKASDSIMVEPKQDRIRKRERTEETGRHKQFLINGVDFHAGEIVVHRQGQVLEDAFSVKGDYFYLKKGEIVNIRFAIGEYVEIKFEQKIGYFPASLIRLIEGERWRTK